MDKKTAIEKIKKCLRLAKSANEHEAAQALKHAQAMMREHGLTDFDVELSEVADLDIKFTKAYAAWQAMLVCLCKAAFGVQVFLHWHFNQEKRRYDQHLHFYGIAPKPELARYAYDVLLRQLRAARRNYLATELKRVKNPKNRTYRIDEFSEGWITSVRSKVHEFAVTKEEKNLLDSYIKKFGKMEDRSPRQQMKVASDVKKQAENDWINGRIQGREAQLNHAMDNGEQQKMIGADS